MVFISLRRNVFRIGLALAMSAALTGTSSTFAQGTGGPMLQAELKIVFPSPGNPNFWRVAGVIRNVQSTDYQAQPSQTYKLSFNAYSDNNSLTGPKSDSQSSPIPNIPAGSSVAVFMDVPPWYLNRTVSIDGKLELMGTNRDNMATAKWDLFARENLKSIDYQAGPPKKLVIGMENASSTNSDGVNLEISFTPAGRDSTTMKLGTAKTPAIPAEGFLRFEITPPVAIPNGPGMLWATIPSRGIPSTPNWPARTMQMSVEIPE